MTDRERNVSDYGAILRHLRIDRGEKLKDMALKVGMQASNLSAIETAARDIPLDLTDKICDLYNLSKKERETLEEAELNVERKTVQIDMQKLSDNRLAKKVVLEFAKKVADFDDDRLRLLHDAINRKDKDIEELGSKNEEEQ